METERLIELLEDAGCEVHSYSGRWLFGAQCVAFTIDNYTSLLGVVAEIVAVNAETGLEFELARLFKTTRTDSMGTGTVVYFPRMKWEGVE